ncbi:CrcB family protein [Brachybacterium sp. EF45031]|nr:CrcB family protein [Brachybacterium sillae]
MRTVEMAALTEADLRGDEEVIGSGPPPVPLRRRTTVLLVAAGGAIGALLRYALGRSVTTAFSPTLVEIPWDTLATNILGCLLLGLLTGWSEVDRRLPAWWRPLIGTGMLGGFTTMSLLVLEWAAMVGSRFPLLAFGYGNASVLGGLGAAVLGMALGMRLGRRRTPAGDGTDPVPTSAKEAS